MSPPKQAPTVTPSGAKRGYLLDTSVIPALAPSRQAYLLPEFGRWLHAHDEQLFIPGIAVAELERGICKLRRAGGVERAERLGDWLDGLVGGFPDRLLARDLPATRIAGRLSDAAIARGVHPGFAGIAIAAIASQHDLLLLTRNLKHFEPLAIECRDPLLATPPE